MCVGGEFPCSPAVGGADLTLAVPCEDISCISLLRWVSSIEGGKRKGLGVVWEGGLSL